ncbi:hypothetical protein [Vagococcus jeotgali]|uniref:hypothetical protein n=1 Tax=Vagococcus jeotgali TaxID=3109030 RepID=UPI002DDC8543|nr:hypothetical protein [Vagococcus sp. B2T-5]
MQVDGFNQSIKSVEEIQSKIKDKGKQVRYAKGKKTPLTRGKVSEVTSFDPEKIILEVEMSQPEPIYLKNYVGSEYTSGAWSEQGMEELYENYGMTYSKGLNDMVTNDNMLLSKGLTGDRQMSFDMISQAITTYYGEDYGQFYQGVVWNLEMSLYTETPLSAKKLEMTRHCHELTSHYVFNKQKWRQKRQMKKTLLTMFYQE